MQEGMQTDLQVWNDDAQFVPQALVPTIYIQDIF